MRNLLIGLWIILSAPHLLAQGSREVVLEQHPFRLYSAFWPNLHHILYAEAWSRRPSTEENQAGSLPEPLNAKLTGDERRAWESAVAYYEKEVADYDLFFEQRDTRKFLITVGEELPATGLKPEHRQALSSAAPVYRKYWWPGHDRANRSWAADTMAKIVTLSPSVPKRLEQLYGTPWFTSTVRVDIVRVGNRQGAYSAIDPAPAHITISSSKADLEGWMGAEIMFHEASHALARPMMEAFGKELRAQGKNGADLWHVALFYMTGEVVRQALASRGTAYQTYMYKTGLFDRVWSRFKAPIETHWKAYVNGEVSRDESMKRIVAEIK
jgi:hypothetical protein